MFHRVACNPLICNLAFVQVRRRVQLLSGQSSNGLASHLHVFWRILVDPLVLVLLVPKALIIVALEFEQLLKVRLAEQRAFVRCKRPQAQRLVALRALETMLNKYHANEQAHVCLYTRDGRREKRKEGEGWRVWQEHTLWYVFSSATSFSITKTVLSQT